MDILLVSPDEVVAGEVKGLDPERVHCADGVDQAIERYYDLHPFMIILDLRGAASGNRDIIGYVRNQANDPDVYILCITDSVDNDAHALNLGANDLLAYPCTGSVLEARVAVAKRQCFLTRQLTSAYERISSELESTLSIQECLIPREKNVFQGVEITSLYRPSGRASGDYFDYFAVGEQTLRTVIADVSGHGGRAAFIMAVVRTIFRMTRDVCLDLAETMTMLNNHLREIVGDQSDFVTLFAADIDLDRMRLAYVNAGHCPGILRMGGQTIHLEPQAPVLGFFELDFEILEVNLHERFVFFLFTDGLYEWEVRPGEFCGLERLLETASRELVNEAYVVDRIMEALKGESEFTPLFRDDVTALCVRK